MKKTLKRLEKSYDKIEALIDERETHVLYETKEWQRSDACKEYEKETQLLIDSFESLGDSIYDLENFILSQEKNYGLKKQS